MMKPIIIEKPHHINTVIAACNRALAKGGKYEVEVRKYGINKTYEQLKLWHMWMGELEEKSETGIHRIEFNKICNKAIVLPLYLEHDINNFAETWESLSVLRDSRHPQYHVWYKVAIDSVSKAHLTIKQMAKALNDLHIFAYHEYAVSLTLPSMRGLIDGR